jgi:hypothetical protein
VISLGWSAGGCFLSWDEASDPADGGSPFYDQLSPRHELPGMQRMVTGSIANLKGSGLVLTLNGEDDLTLAPDATSLRFAKTVPEGTPYTVAIKTMPQMPVQNCAVGNATGVAGRNDIDNVTVSCTTEGYRVKVNVADVVGQLEVANGTDTLIVRQSGTHSFSRVVPTRQKYEVAVSTQPAGQRCLVTGGAGVMGTADVIVPVRCFDDFVARFDSSTDLPANWSVSVLASSGDPPFAVVKDGASSAPNCLRIAGSQHTLDAVVVTPPIPIVTDSPQLVFRHAFEASGYDGAVLEMKVNDEPFMDILAAAGADAFVSFGYNTTIGAPLVGNPPLKNRKAWSGSSDGYKTTVVNLPPSTKGKNVSLRWRWGNDDAGTDTSGWRIDDVVVHR